MLGLNSSRVAFKDADRFRFMTAVLCAGVRYGVAAWVGRFF